MALPVLEGFRAELLSLVRGAKPFVPLRRHAELAGALATMHSRVRPTEREFYTRHVLWASLGEDALQGRLVRSWKELDGFAQPVDAALVERLATRADNLRDEALAARLRAIRSAESLLAPLELCLRRAIQKYGVPRKVYYDNGQTFRSHHMRYICGRLDIQHPIHTTVYRPEGHGKIEALNKKFLGFIAEVKASSIQTLGELNEALWAWLDLHYQSKVHGETREAPLTRWRAGIDRVRYADEEAVRQAFLWSERRTTDKACVFSLFNVRYQVPGLQRRKVEVRYDPEALHEVEIWLNGKFAQRARPLDVHPFRRPKPPPPPSPPSTDVVGDWLGHLVARRREEQAPEPDPRTWKRDADERREANTVGLVELLRDRLDPHVVDEVEIRAWAARFGPVELDGWAVELDALLESPFPASRCRTRRSTNARASAPGPRSSRPGLPSRFSVSSTAESHRSIVGCPSRTMLPSSSRRISRSRTRASSGPSSRRGQSSAPIGVPRSTVNSVSSVRWSSGSPISPSTGLGSRRA
ncbi:MAG: transposase [Alphaproteobacteria bacterium]|nr:transposase [Alphaproteobacteria bacterium]